jgi:hypothetical protein
MKQMILAAILSFGFSSAFAMTPYYAEAELNLNNFKTKESLMAAVSELTQMLFVDGSDEEGNQFSCQYYSNISGTKTVGDKVLMRIGFDFQGDKEMCGDGLQGMKVLCDELKDIKGVKIGPIQSE